MDGDLLVEDAIFRDIQPSGVIDVNSSDQVIDAGGRVVTAGIVDMHSHMLAASFPVWMHWMMLHQRLIKKIQSNNTIRYNKMILQQRFRKEIQNNEVILYQIVNKAI